MFRTVQVFVAGVVGCRAVNEDAVVWVVSRCTRVVTLHRGCLTIKLVCKRQ
jgi:hypothetical protein